MAWQFGLSVAHLTAAIAVMLFASFVKGVAGFAMPMILVSGPGSFLPAESALAALILSTIATNLSQSLRQGCAAAGLRYGRVRLRQG